MQNQFPFSLWCWGPLINWGLADYCCMGVSPSPSSSSHVLNQMEDKRELDSSLMTQPTFFIQWPWIDSNHIQVLRYACYQNFVSSAWDKTTYLKISPARLIQKHPFRAQQSKVRNQNPIIFIVIDFASSESCWHLKRLACSNSMMFPTDRRQPW